MMIGRVMTNVLIILTHVENERQTYSDDIKARFPRGMSRALLNSARQVLPVDEAMLLVDSPQACFWS